MKVFLSLFIFFIPLALFSQNQRSYQIIRTTEVPIIDGVLNDSCWNIANVTDSFIQRELNPNEPSNQKTEVRLLYDDEAIYVFAQMYETSSDSVLRELSTRDNEANADLFGLFLDTYNDDINAFGFFVTAAGTQIDARYSSEGQDFNWNAVWVSNVKINANGWSVEMKIPYGALRFSKEKEQVWGLNIIRKIRRLRENSFWNKVDPTVDALVAQFGELQGLKDIKPPLRLSLTPYVAGQLNHYPYNQENLKDLTYSASGGMDVKYGISDGFTLDMTLVPDFSQVQSDNQVLNLSPFEVQFQERRPFFTEGTELFNKGGLFYSRRVGGLPFNYYGVYNELKEGENIIKNPSQEKLMNATKLSGRTKNNLGVGVFNAITGNTFATVADSIGNTRTILSSPRSNYNIVVLDQALRNNSFITVMNTNVMREGHNYDANVSGAGFNLNSKGNRYAISGAGVVTQQFYTDSSKPEIGHYYHLDFGKSGGNFKWNLAGDLKTDKYDPNDLGINFINNTIETRLQLSYNIYKPFWKVNSFFNNLSITYQRMYNPNTFGNFGIYGDSWTTFSKHFFTTGFWYGIEPVVTYDYFEPRVFGRYYTFPINYSTGGFISSDYRKKLALDVNVDYRIFNENEREYKSISISPRYRVNNKLSFNYECFLDDKNDDIGFVNFDYETNDITFGRRKLKTVSNTISSVYKFTNKMSLTFRLRHYWSEAVYKEYYSLDSSGCLNADANYLTNHNVNFNAFNIDMVFFWQFSQGSELNVVWKDAVLKRDSTIDNGYLYNFNNSLSSPQSNSISIKLLYYIDYLMIKKAFKKTA